MQKTDCENKVNHIIRKAMFEDVERVMEIIEAAKVSLRERGVDQWQRGYPDEQSVIDDVKNGKGYVVEEDGEVIATAHISFDGEPSYEKIEGAWLSDGEFCVIHKMAVAKDRKRGGTATAIFDEAVRLAKERGVKRLRIDTHRDNAPMRAAVAKYGFSYCGIIYLAFQDSAERLAFEKIIS